MVSIEILLRYKIIRMELIGWVSYEILYEKEFSYICFFCNFGIVYLSHGIHAKHFQGFGFFVKRHFGFY